MNIFVVVFLIALLAKDGISFDDCKNEKKSVPTEMTCRGKKVTEVPNYLPRNITQLYLSGTHIRQTRKNAFVMYPNISTLFFRDSTEACMLEKLEEGTFNGLHRLMVLGLVGCERLTAVGRGVFGSFRSLQYLQIYRNGLTSVPDLSKFKTKRGFMIEIDLSSNRIREIQSEAFSGVKTHDLKLDSNRLTVVKNNAFYNAQISQLHMVNNPSLKILEEDAFNGIKNLRKLNLSKTSIQKLPVKGLANITELYIRETKSLVNFPSVLQFNNIKIVQLYYPHHCCAFKNPQKQDPAKWQAYEEFRRKVQETCARTTIQPVTVTSPMHTYTSSSISPSSLRGTTIVSKPRNKRFLVGEWLNFHSNHFDSEDGDFLDIENQTDYSDFHTFEEIKNFPRIPPLLGGDWGDTYPVESKDDAPRYPIEESIFHDKSTFSINFTEKLFYSCGEIAMDFSKVSCIPEPDAFNPCEDVMGYKWLRIFVWVVVMAALLGNIIVLAVLITSRSKMTVAKFLMCNLAFADFLMGIYLLLLASIDAHTLGEYFNYAIIWQNEGGCQAAGFITVFSSELSIFTLTVITLERWYAISHAIHLTKRLKLRQAVVIMACGWSYAAIMAHLPLVGISDYGNVSVCLPMKVETTADLAYIISLLVINGLAFLIICMCYLNMYFRVRGSESTANSSDATIAKRMAMLVFTNFICWAPIAFFGLTASAGLPLIDITNSKILLVFFYPLNSCANPYLYVIITKQFRKDMYVLLGKYGICTERANRYKLSITNSKTVTHSRKDSLALNNVIHPVEGSFTQFTGSFKSSKGSKNGTPSLTPQRTPFLDGHSPNHSVRFRTDSLSRNGENKACDRKLSIVPEINSSSNRGHHSETNVDEMNHPQKVRSASEYVIFFPQFGKESCHNVKCSIYQKQMSQSTNVSSNSGTTEHSSLSDGSFEDPWVLHDVRGPSENIQVYEPIKEEEKSISGSICEINDNENDNDDDDLNDKDEVQQTLLKHCTMRDSPATEKCFRVNKSDAKPKGEPINGFIRSPSNCSLDEFDENSSLFNELRLS